MTQPTAPPKPGAIDLGALLLMVIKSVPYTAPKKQDQPDNHETMRRTWKDWTIWTPADDAAFNAGYRQWREDARV